MASNSANSRGPLERQSRALLREAGRSMLRLERAASRSLAAAAEAIIECFEAGGTVYFCGNGGSAADSQHLAAELAGRYMLDRPSLAAIALTTNTSSLTAIGNDFGYEQVFSRQLEGLGVPGDVLVAITTSGNSVSILRAVETAHAHGMIVVGLTGAKGERFARLCDHALVTPSPSTPRIQEGHIAMGHTLCELIERALFPVRAGSGAKKSPAPKRAGAVGSSRVSGSSRATKSKRASKVFLRAVSSHASGRGSLMLALLQGLRPKQWTKNLLLFVGILFSRQFGDPQLVLRAAAGFLAFSLLSGSVYLLNDLMDVKADRLHPKKRLRPIASGRLPVAVAWGALVPLLAIVVSLAWWLGPGFMITASFYLAINLSYSFGLKHQVLIDVFLLALGFVLRAMAGVELLLPVAPTTALSPWLLVCTFFGALFLGLAKRRREMANAGSVASERRAVLQQYTPELLDGLLIVSASSSLMSYALYTIWPATVAKFGTEALLYTVPFVAYGIFRYLYLVRVSESTEDPSQVLLSDRPLGACVVLYVIAVVFILYFGH